MRKMKWIIFWICIAIIVISVGLFKVKIDENHTNASDVIVEPENNEQKPDVIIEPSSLYGIPTLENQFQSIGLPCPSSVFVFFGHEKNRIGFIYEYGLKINFEETEHLPVDSIGSVYLYLGELTQISDHVFSAKGNYIDSWNEYERYVCDDVDFYLIVDGEKYYFCFENLPVNELESYTSDSYALFHKYDKDKVEIDGPEDQYPIYPLSFDPDRSYKDVEDEIYIQYLVGGFPSEYDYIRPQLDLMTTDNNLYQQLKEHFHEAPTDITIDFDYRRMRWNANNGIGLNLQDWSQEDNDIFSKWHSIYAGDLTELAEGIYAAKGEFIPKMLKGTELISDTVDFYVKVKNKKMYIILEPFTLQELLEYESDTYYTLSDES